MHVQLRPFVNSDAGGVLDQSDVVDGITAEMDGRIAAYAGLHVVDPGSHRILFMTVLDERCRRPCLIYRLARKVVAIALARGEVWAFCDEARHPRSRALLERLGFDAPGLVPPMIAAMSDYSGCPALVATQAGV